MITYRISTAQNCYKKLTDLLNEHYKEVSLLTEYKLKPDWNIYLNLDRQGKVKVVLCEDNDKIIGYIVFFITQHLHYVDCLVASEDIYYLKPEYRKGRIGIKMFKFAEEYLKSININMIKYSTKTHLDNSKLFEYLQYSLTEKVYTKMLKA